MGQVEQSLVIIKPDAVQRGLTGEIINRYERRGLKILAMDLRLIDVTTASQHYAEHVGKPFYQGLVDYITSRPAVVMVVSGRDAIGAVRATNGATNPIKAEPGTIRGDYGLSMGRNLVHASDSPESAAREIGIFYGSGLNDWDRETDKWVDDEIDI